jgi:hypothetical protein
MDYAELADVLRDDAVDFNQYGHLDDPIFESLSCET